MCPRLDVDRSILTLDECCHAIEVPKWTQDPVRKVDSPPSRSEEEIEVFHDDPLLASKGVQLLLVFTKNRGGQLRHRLVDEARNQTIAMFHSEDNHKVGPNGDRAPHVIVGHFRGKQERRPWEVPAAIDLAESKEAVFAYLSIEVRPSGLDKWPTQT